MLGPSRRLPRVGAHARIAHFGGTFELVRIVAVDDGGRSLEVLGERGERIRFELSRASARFLSASGPDRARLELLED